MINRKDVIIRKLQDENLKLRSRVEVLGNKFNNLEQYGRRNNTDVSGIPDSISDNELKYSENLKATDIEVHDRDIEIHHRIGKSKGNSKKAIVRFCSSKISKRALPSTHQQMV